MAVDVGTLEGDGDEFETGHCWLPEAMRETLAQVRLAEQAEGSGAKRPTAIEREERDWRADPGDGLRPLRGLRASWSPGP